MLDSFLSRELVIATHGFTIEKFVRAETKKRRRRAKVLSKIIFRNYNNIQSIRWIE